MPFPTFNSVFGGAAPAPAATRQPLPFNQQPLPYNQWAPLHRTGGPGNFAGATDIDYQNYLNTFNQGSPAGAGTNPAYSTNPTPQPGVPNPFGAVPGPVGLPNRFSDLAQVFPNLSATNAQVSGVLNDQIAGRVPNADVAFLQDREAAAAQAGGMPGTNVLGETLFGHRSARDYGMLEMARQQQGLGNYANIINAISGTQTVSPETQIGLGDRNAYYASAPNPTAANTYAQNRYDQYRRQMYGQGGGYQRPGPQEGTGSYVMPTGNSGGTPTSSPAAPSPSGSSGTYSTGKLGPGSYTTQSGDIYGLPENWNSMVTGPGANYSAQNRYLMGLDEASRWLREHPQDYGGGEFNAGINNGPNAGINNGPNLGMGVFDWAPIGPPGEGLDAWDAAHPGAIPPGPNAVGSVNTVPKDWSDIQNIYMLMGYPMPNVPDNYGELDIDRYNNALYDAAQYNPYVYE